MDLLSELVPAISLALKNYLFEVASDSWTVRSSTAGSPYAQTWCEPRMNHLRALQSGLGSLDRLDAELTRKICERIQFEQLREELIEQSRSRL